MTSPNGPLPRHAPADIAWQARVGWYAVIFFHFNNNQASWESVDKVWPNAIQPLSAGDFLTYLTKTQGWDAWALFSQVQRVLARLVRVGLLEEFGGVISLQRTYLATSGLPASQAPGDLWLAEALGAGHIIQSYGSVTVAVTGVDENDDPHIGTGLAISPNHVLTCGHVATGMRLDQYLAPPEMLPPIPRAQHPTGRLEIRGTHVHPTIDVAVLEVDAIDTTQPGGMAVLQGVVFRDPVWADEALVFGYPPVPTTTHAPLVVQRGEVVNPNVSSWSSPGLFLFSSTARPGHSGGPVIAQDGRVVGLAAQQLTEQDASRSPYYAGLRASVISQALNDLSLGHLISIETWE